MQITYRIGRGQVWRANWQMYWHEQRRTWWIGALAVAALIGAMLFVPFESTAARAVAIVAALLMLGAVVTALGLLLATVGAWWPGVVGQHTDTLTPEGLRGVKATGKEQFLPWKSLRKIERTPWGIMLRGPVLAWFIPTWAFVSADEEERFLAEALALWSQAR